DALCGRRHLQAHQTERLKPVEGLVHLLDCAEAYGNGYGKSLELALVALPGTRTAMTSHDCADATHPNRADEHQTSQLLQTRTGPRRAVCVTNKSSGRRVLACPINGNCL